MLENLFPEPGLARVAYFFVAHRKSNGSHWMAMVFGLGFVLAFGLVHNFWSYTRMAARNMMDSRRTPLIAALPKMFFSRPMILPGMIAVALAWQSKNGDHLPSMIYVRSRFRKGRPCFSGIAARRSNAESQRWKSIRLAS